MVSFLSAVVVLAQLSPAQAADLHVTSIQAVHRHGQTFITWKDVAEGEAGVKYRYSLYRSGAPITAANLDKAELCYHGVLNNSAKQFGYAFNMKDRLDPAKPYSIIEEGGKPLPPWSGLAVHTVRPLTLPPPARGEGKVGGKAYYAIVATDEKLNPVSAVVPGKSATTAAVEEKPGPIQPIKLYDSKERKTYVAQTSITGQKGLPLSVGLHGSQGAGGPAGEWGDYYLYFGTPAMGYRDGLPGVFTVQENRSKDGNSLVLRPRDAIEHPSGRGAFETMWLGYYCIPQAAKHGEPRYYRFTENRLLWMIDWSIQRYDADAQRVSMGGSSMGGLGSINVGFRHPELFAAVYPSTAPFLWWPPWSLVGNQGRDTKALMADGKTLYTDYTNSPRFAAERHEDMPFLGWAVGRRDPNHNWQEYVDMVKALTANHHGFTFAWNDGGHSEGGRPMGVITRYYPAAKFARNRSYPAFGNSSIDSNLGNGSKDDGAREGGINLGFDWKELLDQEGKWSVTVSNELAKEPMTVDVTPRRCQKFKLKPGAECQWTTSTGASGTVAADKWGLVTVPKVVVKAKMGTVLTIRAADDQRLNVPPKGFRALFDGKTLSNWRGQIDEDPRRVAKATKGLSAEEIKKLQEATDKKTFAHWKAEEGLIHYDGARGIGNIETREHFGNFELYLDWKIPKGGDSGIFPRNMPQVQIWDPAGGKRNVVGSGGLDNNGPDIPPKKKADNPVGEWNTFYIKMVGDKIWVTLNGVAVIEGEKKGNYWTDFKEPPPAKGPIVLQSHGSHLWFRNLFIRELEGN